MDWVPSKASISAGGDTGRPLIEYGDGDRRPALKSLLSCEALGQALNLSGFLVVFCFVFVLNQCMSCS